MRKITQAEYTRIKNRGKHLKPKDIKPGMEVWTSSLAWNQTANVVAIDGDFVWLEYLGHRDEVSRISQKYAITEHSSGKKIGCWDHNHLQAVPAVWEKGKTYRFKAHHREAGVVFTVTAVDEDGNALAQATAPESRTYFMGLPWEDREDYREVESDPEPEAQPEKNPSSS